MKTKIFGDSILTNTAKRMTYKQLIFIDSLDSINITTIQKVDLFDRLKTFDTYH